MHHAMLHEQERSGAAWSLEWMILPQMAQATARSLSAATEICSRITRMGS
jgi:3-carboxy-cis,cis-muconate cycloisomerase